MLEQQPREAALQLFCIGRGKGERTSLEVFQRARGEDGGHKTADDADRSARFVAEDIEQGDKAKDDAEQRHHDEPDDQIAAASMMSWRWRVLWLARAGPLLDVELALKARKSMDIVTESGLISLAHPFHNHAWEYGRFPPEVAAACVRLSVESTVTPVPEWRALLEERLPPRLGLFETMRYDNEEPDQS